MNEASRPGLATLGWESAQHVERLCRELEAALSKGERPPLEGFVEQATGVERAVLVHEVVALEIAYRRRAGEQPRAEDYLARFAELDPQWLAREIANAAPAPDAKSSSKGSSSQQSDDTKIRCPQCHNPIQLTSFVPGVRQLLPGLRRAGNDYDERDAAPGQVPAPGARRPRGFRGGLARSRYRAPPDRGSQDSPWRPVDIAGGAGALPIGRPAPPPSSAIPALFRSMKC
jgi:hypothetical protein